MLIFLFLRLLCCQSKAVVAIIHMYMYNNLLILKLPWLSRHARATCANQIKAADYGPNWYMLKKKLFASKYLRFLEYWQFWQ